MNIVADCLCDIHYSIDYIPPLYICMAAAKERTIDGLRLQLIPQTTTDDHMGHPHRGKCQCLSVDKALDFLTFCRHCYMYGHRF